MGCLPVCTNDSRLIREHVVENSMKKFNKKKKRMEENLITLKVCQSINQKVNDHLYYRLVVHLTSS